MILQSLAGLPAFLAYFCTAIGSVVAYLFVYTRVTPHNEFQLIRDNDPAAAIALGLSLLGFTLPLVSAIAHSANVRDCLICAVVALVAQETDLVAATGSYLSSFTLAVTEVTERAQLPVLTLSYSDLLTDRGFKFIFQTAAPASVQSQLGLPELMKLAENASGKRPKTVAMLMDNTATSVATAKALKEKLLAQEGLQLVVEEVWTPPLADATPLIQKVRSARPDLLLFMPNAISDAKLGLEKINEFGLGQGKIPTVSFSITIAEPDMLQSVTPEVVQGIMTIVANWGCKGHEDIIAELKAKYKEPWATQNVISTYGDMWLMKAALEKAGKADRLAVAEAFRTMDGGPAKYYPGGQLKFDDKGRRVGAGVVIVQWQNGVPVTVYPSDLAQSSPFWPKKS